MEETFDEIKTPYKYGVVFRHPDKTKFLDSPTIFHENNVWYMSYIIFNGQGYETWLAESADLIHWKSKGKILSFTENTWDANQKAGYMSLVDIDWGGSYSVEKFQDKYWMSYLGGSEKGYETGVLGIGIVNSTILTEAIEWNRLRASLKTHFFQKTKIMNNMQGIIFWNSRSYCKKL
ncbi:MAG: hypothetical protein L3J11_09875 [Draconibacterium sp.]|nr:hypothetical protein [Draconibacterium sp.]